MLNTTTTSVLALSGPPSTALNLADSYSLSSTNNILAQTNTKFSATANPAQTLYQTHTVPNIFFMQAQLHDHLFPLLQQKTFLLQLHKPLVYLLLQGTNLYKIWMELIINILRTNIYIKLMHIRLLPWKKELLIL